MKIRERLLYWLGICNSHPDEGTRDYADRQATRYARRIDEPTAEEAAQAEKPLPEDGLFDD